MRSLAFSATLRALAVLRLDAPCALASDLDEPLRVFEPLLAKNWEGGYVGSDA